MSTEASEFLVHNVPLIFWSLPPELSQQRDSSMPPIRDDEVIDLYQAFESTPIELIMEELEAERPN